MKARRFIALALAIALSACHLSPAFAQSFPRTFDSVASTNSTLVVTGNVQIRALIAANTTVVIYWLKLYDTAVAPTCGTTLPVVFKMPIPFGASNAGGGFAIPIPDGLQFKNGLGFCITANQADSDATVAATGLVVDFGIKQ